MPKHYHDATNRKIYRVPAEPDVQEARNSNRRQVIGWTVSALVDVIRADNRLENGGWKYTTKEHWEQTFENIGNRYTNSMVIEHFFNNHLVNCELITQEEYEKLKTAYEAEGRRAF